MKMENLKTILTYVFEKGKLKAGDILVAGCSTSEVEGGQIGKNSNYETGGEIARTLYEFAQDKGIYIAVQCCEHLNRALVVERECLEHYRLTEVSAVPHQKAGGSCGSAYYRLLRDPALAESIQGKAGIDIGDTFIGMHLMPVAVPLRHETIKSIGCAHLTMAVTRPRLIGGERAKYTL